jgi:hypothetical protein
MDVLLRFFLAAGKKLPGTLVLRWLRLSEPEKANDIKSLIDLKILKVI